MNNRYLKSIEPQEVIFNYNIRGWLTNINDVSALGDDMFAMKLSYKNAASPQFNGNIGSVQWNTTMFGTHSYQFFYDGANRLTNGWAENFNTSYTYDKNGNISNLTRQGKLGGSELYGMIDDLTYTYLGNQLQSVNDDTYQSSGFSDNGIRLTTEYDYDNNGNMIADLNKSIDTIHYNHLNLPDQIVITPTSANQEINYLYNAVGQKLRKATRINSTPATTTDYVGSFIYEDGVIQSILTSEGRVVVDGSSYEYQYFLKDHLGNTRITFNESKQIIQEDSYYPFGMAMAGLSHETGTDLPNKYLYNGKELQDDFGLDWYDYGWRQYDPALAWFTTQDRFAEKYLDLSPYQYAANNPILFVDVNGDSLYVANNEDTHNDIKSLAKDKNQQYISFNEDGSVTLDFSGADAKTQKKAMRDKGLQLIGNLVESQDADGNTENYYYEASNTREGVMPDGSTYSISLDSKAGTETGLNDNSFATNLSTTDHGVPEIPEVKPANGYDGTVYISPGTLYNKTSDGTEYAVPRSSLVRHELSESYNRTHKKMNYNQAHQSAGGIGTYTRFKYAPLKK